MWAIDRRPPQEETTLGFWFLSMRKETMQYINCSLTLLFGVEKALQIGTNQIFSPGGESGQQEDRLCQLLWNCKDAPQAAQAFARLPLCRAWNQWCHWWQQPTHHEREIPAEAYRECVETVHKGVCHLSHMQIPGHDPEQGDAVVLPAVHDLPLLLQCPDHQDWFPGRHWEEKVTSSQNHLDPSFLGCLDHHPGQPGFAPPHLSLCIYLAFVIFWI